MCLNFGASAPTVNSRGDMLGGNDVAQLYGGNVSGGLMKALIDPNNIGLKLTPAQRGEMLNNWLTAGGPPKPIDPSKIFAEKSALAPVKEKAAAGAGTAGLFGAGLLVGDLVPKTKDLNPAAPMQPGVPYSVPPMAKMGAK